jgi:hypothetical protein
MAGNKEISLTTAVFLANGFTEAEALKKIRDLGSTLDGMCDSDSSYDDYFLVEENVVFAKSQEISSRIDLTTEERMILKHLWMVLFSWGDVQETRRSLSLLDSPSSLAIFDAIILTYLAGGFRIEPSKRHNFLARPYGCASQQRDVNVNVVKERDVYSRPTCKDFYNSPRRWYFWEDIISYWNKSRSEELRKNTKSLKEGHLAIAVDTCCPNWLLYCLSAPVFVTVEIACCCIVFNGSAIHDPAGESPICFCIRCFRHDVEEYTEEEQKTEKYRPYSTVVIASDKLPLFTNISNTFLNECRIAFSYKTN